MLIAVAYGMAVLLGLAIIVIGVRFLVVPGSSAAAFGVPAKKDGDAAYLAVKGVRDITCGVTGLVLLALAGGHAAGLFMLVATLIPLGDTVIVLRHGGTKAMAFGVHSATAVVMLAVAVLLLTT
ncbi:MAG TPA: DUF4267 domain-containing protein [Nonomuraea sp.]|nr:DUF4267 domain-containing protein [Nonomuraea sp.]